MASIRVDNKSTSYISVEVYNLNYSYPDKRFTFYRDGTQVFTYTMTVPSSTYAFYYTYDGLDSGTSYNLEVDIEMFISGLGYTTEDELSITASTDGSGGGGEWTLASGGLQFNISSQAMFSPTISAGYTSAILISFANSGSVTFYSTGSGDMIGFLAPESTGFDDSTGNPTIILAQDDDSGDGNNFRFTYNVTARTYYALFVRHFSVSASSSPTVYIVPESLSAPTYSISNTSNSVTFTVQNRGSYYMRFYVRYDGSSTAKVYDSEEVEGGYVAQDSYTVTGLSPGTSYAVNVYYATTRYNPSDGTAIGAQYFTTGGSSIALWDWNTSNGSATATQTRRAYTAITNHGNLSDFSYKVWNDLCSKVNEICAELGRSWHIGNYLPYGETLMSDQDKVLTAIRFNALIHQFDHKGYVSTGIEEQQSGDTVFGSYFITIAECINDWIEKL